MRRARLDRKSGVTAFCQLHIVAQPWRALCRHLLESMSASIVSPDERCWRKRGRCRTGAAEPGGAGATLAPADRTAIDLEYTVAI